MSKRTFSSATPQSSEVEEELDLFEDAPSNKRPKKKLVVNDEDEEDCIADMVDEDETGDRGESSQKNIVLAGRSKEEGEPAEIAEEDLVSSQIGRTFVNVMKNGGVKFTASTYFVDDPIKLRKHLEKHLTESHVISEFCAGFRMHIQDLHHFKLCLMPFVSHVDMISTNESICRIMLSTKLLQYSVAVDLLEKIPEFNDEAESGENNIPRLILLQFRWLDWYSADKITDKIFEIMEVCTLQAQKEIIGFVPEIVDDTQHKKVVENLKQLLEQQSELMLNVLDALSNLILSEEALKQLIDFVVGNLGSAKVDDLPVVVRFLLQSSTKDTVYTVASKLRQHLDTSSFALEQHGDEMDDILALRNIKSQKNKKVVSKEAKNAVSLILESIKTGIRYKVSLEKAFIKVIQELSDSKEYKILDIWVLFVIYSMDIYRKDAEKLFKKKIKDGLISQQLIRHSITSQADALYQLFPSISHFTGLLLRNPDEKLCSCGKQIYKTLFTVFTSDYHRQELIGALVTHLGSGTALEIDAALDIILHLSIDCLHAVRKLFSYIQGILDYLDGFNEVQLRKVYKIFSILSFMKSSGNNVNDHNQISDQLFILVSKQLSHGLKSKKMGVIGTCMLIAHIGCVPAGTAAISQSIQQHLTSEEFATFKNLLDVALRNCQKIPICHTFLFDELSSAIQEKTLDTKILKHISLILTDLFSKHNFIVEQGAGTLPQLKTRTKVNISLEGWMSLDTNNEQSVAINLLPLIMSGESHQYENMWNMLPSFKLLALCEKKERTDDYLISTMISARIYMFGEEILQTFKSLSEKEKDIICLSLFFAINWFREMINMFTISSAEIRDKILLRLLSIVELERKLDKCLFEHPSFILPQANFIVSSIEESSYKKAKSLAAKKPKKKKKKKTNKKKSKNKDDEEIEEEQGEEEEGEEDEQEKEEIGGSRTSDYIFSPELKNISKLRPFMREIDLSSMEILKKPKLNNATKFYLLQDLLWKTEIVTSRQKRTFFASSSKIGSLFLNVTSTEHFLEIAGGVLPSCLIHLEVLIEDISKNEGDEQIEAGENDPQTEENIRYRLPCIRLILLFVKKLFANVSNNTSKFKSLLNNCRSVGEESENLLDGAIFSEVFTYFEQFMTHLTNFEDVGNLFDVLGYIANSSPEDSLKRKLSDVAGQIMGRDFSKTRGETLCQIITCHIRNAQNPIKMLKTYINDHMVSYLDDTNCEKCPLLDRSRHVYFFRTILLEAMRLLEGVVIVTKDDYVIQRNLSLITNSVSVFASLMDHTKKINMQAVLKEALKFGKEYMKQLLRVLNFLGKQIKAFKKNIFSIFDDLQNATHQLQVLCLCGKVQKNKSLASLVPRVKKNIESYIYKVKLILKSNNMLEAFELSKVKQVDLAFESDGELDDVDDTEYDQTAKVAKPTHKKASDHEKKISKKKTKKKSPKKQQASGNVKTSNAKGRKTFISPLVNQGDNKAEKTDEEDENDDQDGDEEKQKQQQEGEDLQFDEEDEIDLEDIPDSPEQNYESEEDEEYSISDDASSHSEVLVDSDNE